MKLLNKKPIFLKTIVFLEMLLFVFPPYWVTAQEVGKVKCTILADGSSNRRIIKEANLSATPTGFDLNFIDQSGKYLLKLNNKLIIEEALTVGEHDTAMWNLVGYYENPTPLIITPEGNFSITMMVSTRSSCSFKGKLTFSPGAKEKLFGT